MAQLRILLSTFLLVLTVVALVECYPGGAGTEACATLVPQHGAQPQTTTAPYQITLGQSTFGPGDQILVTVDATPGNTNVYRGLALQARRADGSTDTTGTFTIFANDQNNFRFYECDGSPTGAVTHSNRNDKFLPQSFLWTPSDGFTGNVQFRLTVVREFNTFWTNIPSAVLRQEQVNTPPVITCPGPVSVQSFETFEGNFASWDDPICTDVDQSQPSPIVTCTPASGSFFQGLGTTEVTCTCTDNQAATDTCTISVTITPFIITPVNTPPVITCPGPVSAQSFETFEGNFASWDNPVCTDVDQPGANLAVTCTPASGSFFQGLGTTEVTCTCTDNQAATDTCTISVTITPFIPVIPLILQCPEIVSVESLPNNVGNRATFDPVCTDQSGQSLVLTCSPPSNSFFQFGATTVVCTCTDNQGATDTCTISVTITSIGPPGDVCDGNPCFPNECRVSGTDRYTCHSMTGAPCPGR